MPGTIDQNSSNTPSVPLAERMRPAAIDEFVGQNHLLDKGKLLRTMIDGGPLYSIILWGPPGTGKTTLARLIASSADAHFVQLSAVTSGIKHVRDIMASAQKQRLEEKKQTILFIDEIHRFNKAQQDAFLPSVEHGDIVLIGATTENPSFEVVSPLLSRTKVLVLHPLTDDHITSILRASLEDTGRGMGGMNIHVSQTVLNYITAYSQGDARTALNTLEVAVTMISHIKDGIRILTKADVEEALQKKMLLYDKSGEEHYNLISALHKSMRSSDVNAALYWLGRMLHAGEDPLYIARRLVRFASEDIGNADPQALNICISAKDAFHFIGAPEGYCALAQAVTYLATAPKSNAVYKAYGAVERTIAESGYLPVPLHIRNAPTKLMKEIGYGRGYSYDHHYPDAISGQDCMPDNLKGKAFYQPEERGFEKIIKERMEYIKRKKKGS